MRNLIMILLLGSGIAVSGARAATLFVYPDGHGSYPTIQSALDAASPGDTVLLGDGVFTGDGNRDLDYLGKPLLVTAESGEPEQCIIDCEGSETEPHRAFLFHNGETADARLERVTIRGGYRIGAYPDGAGGAILCVGGSATFRTCRIEDNYADQGSGIYAWGYTGSIEDCFFLDNSAGTGSGAAVVLGGSDAAVDHCIFARNTATGCGGVMMVGSTAAISRCTFVENGGQHGNSIVSGQASFTTVENTIVAFGEWGCGVGCHMDGEIELSCCDIYGNPGGGDWILCIADQLGINGNICEDPLFCDLPSGNLHLHADSPCRPASPPNPECDLIGFMEVGCPATGVETPEADVGRRLHIRVEPNPCSGGAMLFGEGPSVRGDAAEILVCDPNGRAVRHLALGAQMRVWWDGRDDTGRRVPGGLYLVRAGADEWGGARPVLVVR